MMLRSTGAASSDIDTNAFFMWSTLPLGFKKRIAHDLQCEEKEHSNEIVLDDFKVVPAEAFTDLITNYGPNWMEFCDCLGENMDKYHLKTFARLIFEAIIEANATDIKTLFKLIPDKVEKVLNFASKNNLVDFLTNTIRSGESIIEILKLFERSSNFDLSDEGIMRRLRQAAYDRDDVVLMDFTDTYPEVIESSFKDQVGLINNTTADGHPNALWENMCSKDVSSVPIEYTYFDKFMKFPIFSEPINTYKWTLAMLALATGKYVAAMKFPLNMADEQVYKTTPFVQGTHITKIEHLLPYIPNENVRRRIVDKYNLPEGLIDPAATFSTLNKHGNRIDVQVLPDIAVRTSARRTRVIDTDINSFTDEMFERMALYKNMKIYSPSII